MICNLQGPLVVFRVKVLIACWVLWRPRTQGRVTQVSLEFIARGAKLWNKLLRYATRPQSLYAICSCSKSGVLLIHHIFQYMRAEERRVQLSACRRGHARMFEEDPSFTCLVKSPLRICAFSPSPLHISPATKSAS